MSLHPLETYLTDLHEIRSTGGAVAETSYYGALERLLNEVGHKLNPQVRCVPQVVNTGAGSPDFGLYTANQFQRQKDSAPLPGQLPERGVIEVKPTKDNSWLRADGEQVTKYWGRYGQVLVTNYHDFVLVGRDENGQQVKQETFSLAPSEAAFWAATAHPRKLAHEIGPRFVEYLTRVMLHTAPLASPADLARYLASYAREAKARVEAARDLPGLALLRASLAEALGLKFKGEDGEHFFRATLVQTIFYGIFSSWVLWARKQSPLSKAHFNWREAAWGLHVPMIAGLFNQIATPDRLEGLDLVELLDWTGLALNRVDRPRFFERFEEEHAIQYFYEPFLKEYDPELRKDLGVWYTPPEIVKYQVARVDAVLREELAIADGLADDNVVILDPCCGTGAYLVEVLRKIHETLEAKGGHALVAQQLKKAAMTRIFGFEILPAPFVVAHLQLGLMLRHLGAPLSEQSKERAGVYLTNALTGWEPPEPPKDIIPDPEGTKKLVKAEQLVHSAHPELYEEMEASRKIKREAPILVILGNPPYNAFAGTSPDEECGLVEVYKEGLTRPIKDGGWGIKKFNLDDLYIRFFRIAERRIVKSGKGVVSFISNYSWSCEPSYVALRHRLLEAFDKFWVENLHGNRKVSEYAPDGRTSETIFAISGFSEGIQQGVTTSLWVKTGKPTKGLARVYYRDDINAAKADERRQQLLDSLEDKNFNRKYKVAKPSLNNRFSFKPENVGSHYLSWPNPLDLSAQPPSNGLMEKRGGALMDTNRDALETRMRAYFDRQLDWEAYDSLKYGLEIQRAGIDPKKVRSQALQNESYNRERIIPYGLRPFDKMWAYYSSTPGVWNRSRPSLWAQCWEGNSFFMTRFRSTATPEGMPLYYVTGLSDDHFIVPDNACFPIRIREGHEETTGDAPGQLSVFETLESYSTICANLSAKSRSYLAQLGIKNPDKDADTAGLIWMHALAIGYSSAYLTENADGIRQDWPRIPLPAKRDALLASAKLGREVAALLDTEKGVSGVTCGTMRPELRTLGVISCVGKESLDPAAGDLDLTAGWGHGGKDGVTMPGKGKCEERPYTDKELEALRQGAEALGLTMEETLARLGKTTCDVYLNGAAYWRNIPLNIWEFYIGGYQVIKKWLSYREKALLGRGLKMEEVLYVTEIACRLAALALLQPTLDANYQAVKADTYAWPSE